MINQADRDAIKEIVKEILLEDAKIFKEIIKEILIENQIIISQEQAKRRERIKTMIEEDFERYDPVFKDLA